MSNSSKTKLVTFAPFLTIANQLDQSIQIREWYRSELRSALSSAAASAAAAASAKANWKVIEPISADQSPKAFWPNFVSGERKQIYFVVRTADGLETAPFPLENPGRFVLIAKEPGAPVDPTNSNVAATTTSVNNDNSNQQQPPLKKHSMVHALAQIASMRTSSHMASSSSPSTPLVAQAKHRKRTSLALNNMFTVLISGGSQNPVTIVIRKYQYGDSVAKLVNLCDTLSVYVRQKSAGGGSGSGSEANTWRLEPNTAMFFIWPDLVRTTVRELTWTVDLAQKASTESCNYEPIRLNKSGKDKVRFYVESPPAAAPPSSTVSTQNIPSQQQQQQDDPDATFIDMDIGLDEKNHDESAATPHTTTSLFPFVKNGFSKYVTAAAVASKSQPQLVMSIVDVSCVSYVDNGQRVILFTKDESLADIERNKESSSMEVFMSLKGMQISLINNVNLELAVVSVSGSRATWNLWKPQELESKCFTRDYSDWLEKLYCAHVMNQSLLHIGRKAKSITAAVLVRAMSVNAHNHNNQNNPNNANNNNNNANNGPGSNFGGGCFVGHDQTTYADKKFIIDFKRMRLQKPERGTLMRTWYPGVFVKYRSSANMMQLRSCLYKVQIDNQLPDAYFPICLYENTQASAPGAGLDANSDAGGGGSGSGSGSGGVKEGLDSDLNRFSPFLSLSLFTEQQEAGVLQIYRHFNFILQEYFLKVDKGFLFSLKDWYDATLETSSKQDEQQQQLQQTLQQSMSALRLKTAAAAGGGESPLDILLVVDRNKRLDEKMRSDLALTREIMQFANRSGEVIQSAHMRFDDFYLSPITFNLSFSVNGTAHTDDTKVTPPAADTVVNFILESLGATITEFKDVKFRFQAFNVNNQTRTWSEMYDEIFDHYKIQVLNQAYVLIFGLDVLGNPFGLVSDFSEGLADLFYDPLLGYFSSSTSAGEPLMTVNMRHRIKKTVNKTISSAAGSGSLITGSIARVFATFTFDKEYKKVRVLILMYVMPSQHKSLSLFWDGCHWYRRSDSTKYPSRRLCYSPIN